MMNYYKIVSKEKTTSNFPELSFKLFIGIKEIISKGKISAYKFSFKRFELNTSGKTFFPNNEALTDRLFDNEGYSKEKIGLNNKTESEILKEKNDGQLAEIIDLNKYLMSQKARIPNTKTKKQLKFINRVIKDFEDWYTINELVVPSTINIIKTFKSVESNRKKLTERIEELCKENKLPLYETVDSKLVHKYLRTVQKERLTESNKPETIRKILSRLGYSKSKSS